MTNSNGSDLGYHFLSLSLFVVELGKVGRVSLSDSPCPSSFSTLHASLHPHLTSLLFQDPNVFFHFWLFKVDCQLSAIDGNVREKRKGRGERRHNSDSPSLTLSIPILWKEFYAEHTSYFYGQRHLIAKFHFLFEMKYWLIKFLAKSKVYIMLCVSGHTSTYVDLSSLKRSCDITWYYLCLFNIYAMKPWSLGTYLWESITDLLPVVTNARFYSLGTRISLPSRSRILVDA